MQYRMQRAKGAGIEIQLAIWPGNGHTVFCLHGLTANCRSWDRVISALIPDYQAIAMDLRGRGGSDQPDEGYDLTHHVADIIAVLDDLQLNQVVLCGHSLGAYIALRVAAQYPHRTAGLILVDGGGSLLPSQWRRIDAAIQPALNRLDKDFENYDAYVAPLKAAPQFQPWSSYFDTYFTYELETRHDGQVRNRIKFAHIKEEMTNLQKESIASAYAKIACPTLILRATQGILTPDDQVLPQQAAENMVASIQQAQWLDIAHSDHYAILFQSIPQRDEAIRDFLRAIPHKI